MDVTAILNNFEYRISRLASTVCSQTPLIDVDSSKVKPIIESLHDVDTVMISTLSGRDKIASFLKRIDSLERILDPSYLETSCNADLKITHVLDSEEQLKYLSESLERLSKLESTFDENTSDVTANSERLNKLMSNVITLKEECKKQSEEIKTFISNYSDSIEVLSKIFIDFDGNIAKLENGVELSNTVE